MTKYSKNYVLQNQMGQNQNIWQPNPSYHCRCTAEMPWSQRKILAVLAIYLTGQRYIYTFMFLLKCINTGNCPEQYEQYTLKYF